MESKIVVLGFDRQYGAEGMLEQIELITLEDAVIASRGVGKDVEIMQARPQGKKGSLKGSGVGLLAGLLLGGPILGVAAGAGIGAIVGSVRDYGLDDKFVEGITESLKPDSSALFLLVKEAKAEEFQGKLDQFEAYVLTTSLPPDREKALREMIEK
ncbi:MAG: DUF1269 domain-containing protein [Anaerolineales bacterium]